MKFVFFKGFNRGHGGFYVFFVTNGSVLIQATSKGPINQVCVLGSAVASEQLWTPIVLINSPYSGSAQGSSSQTASTTFTFTSGPVNLKSSTSSTTTESLSVNNGAALGLFELDTWTVYRTYNAEGGGDAPCTQSYVAKITSRGTSYYDYTLKESGSTSDENEPTTFSHDGYSSVPFSNGYSAETGNIDTCSAPSGSVTTFQTQTTTLSSSSITLTIDGYSTSGTATMTSSSTQTFTYNFPSGGSWNYQTLYSSSNYGAWAFAYVGC